MLADGAHLGVGAERALETILGDKPSPEPEDGLTPAEMTKHLESSVLADCDSYDGCARYCGKLLLDYLRRNPELQNKPDREWDDKFKASLSAEDRENCYSELTGFMWGWALNAARYALELPPVQNPALLETEVIP